MDWENLSYQLTQFDETELFYKSYYLAKQNKDDFDKFLSTLNEKLLADKNLVVPEIMKASTPTHHIDTEFFDDTPRYYLRMMKHSRYMPAYSHSHNFFEILYIWSGTCNHHALLNDLSLKQGDFCIVAPSITHSMEVNDDDSIIFRILLQRSTIEALLMDIFQSNNALTAFFFNSLFTSQTTGYLLFHTENAKDIRSLIGNMYLSEIPGNFYSHIMNNHLMTITFIQLIKEYENNIETPPSIKNSDECFQLIYYMMNDFLTITLEDVAKKFNYNVSYCSLYIKQLTGSTFSQLMRRFRYEKAAKLLTETNMRIQDISSSLHYSNPEGFIRAFKKEAHMTPTEYRRNHSSY